MEAAVIWLLPDVEKVVEVFVSMGTQWRIGMNGATGLDYSALPFVLKALNVLEGEWGDILDDIRLMESVALKEMRKE